MSSSGKYPPLQPLRIVAGWKLHWNTFMEVDPGPASMHFLDGSSLLLMHNDHKSRSIELCWRPELDTEGHYKLMVLNCYEELDPDTHKVVKTPDWQSPFSVFESRNRLEVVAELERLVRELPPFKDPRIMKKPGVVHDLVESLRLDLLENGPHDGILDRILKSDHKQIQSLLIDHPAVDRYALEWLAEFGANSGVLNKAAQKLKSGKFRLS